MIRTSAAVLFALLGFVAAISAQTGPQLPKPGGKGPLSTMPEGVAFTSADGTSSRIADTPGARRPHACNLQTASWSCNADRWRL